MKNKKSLLFIILMILSIGTTLAYFNSSAVFENIFNAGTYKTVTHEEFISPSNWTPGETIPKTIKTKNEGTIPVRVRVKFEESWTSKNGNSLPLIFITNDSNYCHTVIGGDSCGDYVAIINLDNEIDWILKDGYYYYIKEVDPGEETTSLIESITFHPLIKADIDCTTENGTATCESSGDGYDEATYKLKITTETIQAKNYEEVWDNVPISYEYVGDNPCTYEGELVPGTEYVNGQYLYRYRYTVYSTISDDGWSVSLDDRNSETINSPLCSSINNKPIISTDHMFFETRNAINVDLSSLDTSNVINMDSMFCRSNINSVNLSNFDTSKVISMNSMFADTKMLTLDLSSFDTGKVTSMYAMFDNSRATTINVSSFNTSNVTNMSSMFRNSQVTSLDLSNFDTSKVLYMEGMFASSRATTGYCRTQSDCDRFNNTLSSSSSLNFIVKN